MPGQADVHPVQARVDDRVQHGGHRVGFEVLNLAVEPAQHLGRIPGFQGVGAQGAAHPAHDDRGGQAGSGHVADDHAQLSGGQREHVIPVPAHPAAARDVTGRQLRPRDRGQRGRHQAALQRGRGLAVGLDGHGLHGRGGPVRGQLQKLDLMPGEPPRRQRADVQHADHPAARHHRHAHHRLDALGPQDRVEHGGVVDVIQDHRLVRGGDPPGKPPADRDAHALVDLFLQPRGRGGDQLPRRKVQQQHRRRVGLQDVPGPLQQLSKQLAIIQTRQRRVGDRLDGPQLVLDGVRV